MIKSYLTRLDTILYIWCEWFSRLTKLKILVLRIYRLILNTTYPYKNWRKKYKGQVQLKPVNSKTINAMKCYKRQMKAKKFFWTHKLVVIVSVQLPFIANKVAYETV